MAKLVVPSDRVPVVDVKTGIINPVWLKYLQDLTARINAGGL